MKIIQVDRQTGFGLTILFGPTGLSEKPEMIYQLPEIIDLAGRN